MGTQDGNGNRQAEELQPDVEAHETFPERDEVPATMSGIVGSFWREGIVLVLLVLTATGWFHTLYWNGLGSYVFAENEAFIDESLENASRLLVTVGVVKGTADVIEGSSFLGVEFGDLIQPVLDYLDIAWDVVAVATIALLCFKYIFPGAVEMGDLFLGTAFTVFLAALILARFFPHERILQRVCRKTYGFAFLVAGTIYMVIPVSMLTSSWVSQRTTAQLQADYTAIFAEAEAQFGMEEIWATSLRRMPPVPGEDGWTDRFSRVLEEVERTVAVTLARMNRLNERAREVYLYLGDGGGARLARGVLLVSTAYILNGFVYPALSFFFAFGLLKSIINPLLRSDDERIARVRLVPSERREARRRRRRAQAAV